MPIPSPDAESAERFYQEGNVHHVHGLIQPTKISLFAAFREGRNVHLSTWDRFVRTSSATLRGRSIGLKEGTAESYSAWMVGFRSGAGKARFPGDRL